MMSINLRDIAILKLKGSDYCCIISLTSENQAINLMQSTDLTEKSGKLKNIKKGKEILTFHNIEKHKFYWHKTPYYPQVLLRECKYTAKKLIRHINQNLSDFFSDNDSDEE